MHAQTDTHTHKERERERHTHRDTVTHRETHTLYYTPIPNNTHLHIHINTHLYSCLASTFHRLWSEMLFKASAVWIPRKYAKYANPVIYCL